MIFSYNVAGEEIRYKIIYTKTRVTSSRVVKSKKPTRYAGKIAKSLKVKLRKITRRKVCYKQPMMTIEEFMKCIQLLVLQYVYDPFFSGEFFRAIMPDYDRAVAASKKIDRYLSDACAAFITKGWSKAVRPTIRTYPNVVSASTYFNKEIKYRCSCCSKMASCDYLVRLDGPPYHHKTLKAIERRIHPSAFLTVTKYCWQNLKGYHSAMHFRKNMYDEIATLINADEEARKELQEVDPRCSQIMAHLEEYVKIRFDYFVSIFHDAQISK